MTFEKTMDEEKEVDFSMLANYILKNWRIAVIGAIICALLGIIAASVTYVPYYTSKISYVVNTNSNSTLGMTVNDYATVEYMANTYAYVLNSRNMIQRVQAETGISEDISSYISSSLISDSNIMEVRVKTTDAQKSYSIATALNEYLPEMSKMAVKTGSIDVIENPQLALSPDANNNLKKMGALGAVAGLIIVVLFYFTMYFIRRSVRTPEDLTKKVDIKHLGSVPHVDMNIKKNIITGKEVMTEKKEPMLITNKKTGFVFNETYKSMRTKIERFSKKHSSKAILVSSALENEGKTTVAVNIALTLAQNGNKVIIIDCDLRKPAVATVLEVKDQIKVSMIDVIEKKSSVGQAVISLPKLNIDLIGGSKSVSNSSEVLSTKGLSDALDTLRASYDYIIIDTPPSQLFTDAVIMTEVADATVIVVKQDSANIDDVVNIVSDFGQSKAELIGFVFNNVRSASVLPAGYSKKYNYSYYGYGKK
jgi:receptor protein-tyrosine kinase